MYWNRVYSLIMNLYKFIAWESIPVPRSLYTACLEVCIACLYYMPGRLYVVPGSQYNHRKLPGTPYTTPCMTWAREYIDLFLYMS